MEAKKKKNKKNTCQQKKNLVKRKSVLSPHFGSSF